MSAAEKLTATNTMGGDRPRNDMDFYPTPQPLADAICRKLRETIGVVTHIIEPSAGAGPFVSAARREWPDAGVYAVEPRATDQNVRARLIECGADYVRAEPWEGFSGGLAIEHALILGNPPFLLAEEHVRLALSRLGHDTVAEPQPRYLSFLLRASFLAGDKRARGLHLGVGGLRYVWHVIGRPSFTGDGKTDGAEYCVAVWQAGYRGPYEGGWLTWK